MGWIILLAVIQGLTEFLPVSSSAHLIIPDILLGIPAQGLSFDVAIHFGTLVAVLFYYRNTLTELVSPVIKHPSCSTPQREQCLLLLIASIPAAAFGFFAHDIINGLLRAPWIIAITTLFFGILLGVAYHASQTADKQVARALTLREAIVIGLAQSLALIPGVSRSGITMTASLFLKHSGTMAANTSFLLSIPIISMATAYQTLKLYQESAPVDWVAIGVGIITSFVCAHFCITFFLRLLDRIGMWPFVFYRVTLGLGLMYYLF